MYNIPKLKEVPSHITHIEVDLTLTLQDNNSSPKASGARSSQKRPYVRPKFAGLKTDPYSVVLYSRKSIPL